MTRVDVRPNVGTRRRALQNLVWGAAAGAVLAWFVLTGLTMATDDPWRGVPACTDAIADSGGTCHGEPTP